MRSRINGKQAGTADPRSLLKSRNIDGTAAKKKAARLDSLVFFDVKRFAYRCRSPQEPDPVFAFLVWVLIERGTVTSNG